MIVARAPASTANLGPGFDTAAAALDLWNTVEVEEGAFAVEVVGEGAGELPLDVTHLSLQAFALLAPPTGFRFRFENAIPLERGLGSSAAAIGLGLVAGAAAAGHALSDEELLTLGSRLESHLDNLAAVVARWRHRSVAERRLAACPATRRRRARRADRRRSPCSDVDRGVAHVLTGRSRPRRCG